MSSGSMRMETVGVDPARWRRRSRISERVGLAAGDGLFHPFGGVVAVFVPPPGFFFFGFKFGEWSPDHTALCIRYRFLRRASAAYAVMGGMASPRKAKRRREFGRVRRCRLLCWIFFVILDLDKRGMRIEDRFGFLGDDIVEGRMLAVRIVQSNCGASTQLIYLYTQRCGKTREVCASGCGQRQLLRMNSASRRIHDRR